MIPEFLTLTDHDRKDALAFIAGQLGRPSHLLEKDIWVVWALNAVFRHPVGEHLAFKGGTSLSKVYGVIDRFSEDVDLTYDIRKLAPDLVGEGPEPLPPSRSHPHAPRPSDGRRPYGNDCPPGSMSTSFHY